MDITITNELLAVYAEGNVSQEERDAVRQYLVENPEMMEGIMIAMEDDASNIGIMAHEDDSYLENLGNMLDDIDASSKSCAVLPMMAMAAQNIVDNQCAIQCEGIALRHFGFDVTDEALSVESKKEGWLQPDGTALHNIGRLSGARGLNVSHRYHCSLADIRQALADGDIVLAAVDGNELVGKNSKEQHKDIIEREMPNHVVIIDFVDDENVILIDTSTPQQQDSYPTDQFLNAWADSSYYIITISNSGNYIPHPISLDDVEINEDLLELCEAIAENAHEVWAETRQKEGWTYGPFRDDAKKQHPDMLPYNRLPESEKEYDRLMAMNTIKLVKKLGWELKKK